LGKTSPSATRIITAGLASIEAESVELKAKLELMKADLPPENAPARKELETAQDETAKQYSKLIKTLPGPIKN
jgi:hypothetical protein